MKEVVPAAGQYWVNEFKVEKYDKTVVVKVFPTECGLDVPKIVVNEWKSDQEVIDSRNCSSSSNKTHCSMQKCTIKLVQVCANRTVNVPGPNCTQSNNNNNSSSNVTTTTPCQQNNTVSIIQDCHYENITTCEQVIEITNKTNESSKNETSTSAVYSDPDLKDSMVVVSTVEEPSAPVSGHFVLKYTTVEGESFYTKSMFISIFLLFYCNWLRYRGYDEPLYGNIEYDILVCLFLTRLFQFTENGYFF